LEGIVTLKGSVNNISDLLPTYDLFALPSKGEAFALSPIEAMACGLPILVSDLPPYPEFVTSGFGRMVNRDSVTEIQNFLTELIENKEQLIQMSELAVNESDKFSWDNIVNRYIDLINHQ
jgi:glycosyltransferase involved in cell wall biosynthesis